MMRFLGRAALLALTVLVLASPTEALAGGQKLSNVINNTVDSSRAFPFLISLFGYFAGALLCVVGIFKFKDHVDQPANHPLSAGVKRFIAGGMFLSLPFMARAVRGNLFGSTAQNANTVNPSDGLLDNTGLTAGALDKLVVDLMMDIADPMQRLLTLFTYIAAGVFLLVAIGRLTKRLDDGPRGPAGFGTIMTFIASGALFAFGDMMGTFTSSIFGDTNLAMLANIDGGTLGMSADDTDKIQKVIQGVMVFISLVGMIAFIRGWFVLRAFADGQQGATLAQGLTFLFGGALAINLGELVNAIQTTLGLSGITFNP